MEKPEYSFLVVEDTEEVAHNNCTFLHLISPSATCEISLHPYEAKRELERHRPDLLVVDLLFGHKEADAVEDVGISFLKHVLSCYPTINVLVYSTNPELIKHLSKRIEMHKGGFSIVNKMDLREAFLTGANVALSGQKRIPAELSLD
ncbi:hypothetical protein [cf. Phormidesmis sp. LEGE 11477]|uniref:hypothetical protein n=1 Tax=cf. Phormidesmis sp. LEGE 11477 TaxID=1828680 RepID=UPI00188234A6|nr:hypothetical protein [cf. Phormidesmis sp. LEGE 11477]MBE9060109.1 hypothetical protein [cf. Phormidesmis sp. LEGE 11477]